MEFYYPPWDRWYFNRVYPLPDGGLANYFQDISERKAAEKANATLAAIVESSADAIVSKDLNGIITSWNVEAPNEHIRLYRGVEAISRAVSMLYPRSGGSTDWDTEDSRSAVPPGRRIGKRLRPSFTRRSTSYRP